ncbi:hypothetical protein Y032_0061g3268 [Ancylostoma ceylanicum]|nr:hypothetical protein Y032_0061g3268 [Ancylostoma ceylanicum]
MNTWMDELYYVANWMKINGNGYVPAMLFLPRLVNILDRGSGLLDKNDLCTLQHLRQQFRKMDVSFRFQGLASCASHARKF